MCGAIDARGMVGVMEVCRVRVVVVRVVVVRGVVEYTARDAPASRAGHPHAGIARIDRSIDRSVGRSRAKIFS